ISYWASLKNAFKEVDLEMPPVVPRYSISYVPTKLCEALNNKEIDVSHAINFGVSDLKLNWLSNQSTAPIDLLTEEMNISIEFLEKRLLREVNQKYEKEINEYDLISDYLYPNNGLQERIWNPLFLLNDYGFDVFKRVTETSLSFKEDHFVIYL